MGCNQSLDSRGVYGQDRGQLSLSIREEVLKGSFYDESSPDNLYVWRSPRWKMLVYVSSSITDTKKERDILLEHILPKLRAESMQYKIEVTFIDMHWGVHEDSAVDNAIFVDNISQLERCRLESDGLFFLSLQADKYGFIPLPSIIDRKLLDTKLKDLNNEEMTTTAMTWYQLDTNQTPSVYQFKHRRDLGENAYKSLTLPRLRDAFNGISFDPSYVHALSVGKSVTELEARFAMAEDNSSYDISRCHWIHRHFSDDLSKSPYDPKETLTDTFHDTFKRGLLDEYKTWMHSKLSSIRNEILVTEYENITSKAYNMIDINNSDNSIINHNDVSLDDNLDTLQTELSSIMQSKYLNDWEKDTSKLLNTHLNAIIDLKNEWMKNGCGMNMRGAALQEILYHSEHAAMKCMNFKGRFHLLNKAIDFIKQDNRSNNTNTNKAIHKDFDGVCLSLVGHSGTGKSAMIAKLAELINKQELDSKKRRPVIIRFCGLTELSSGNGLSLVRGLCAQIHHLFKSANKQIVEIPKSYEKAVLHLHQLLHLFPVILFIDGLDRLQDNNIDNSRIGFLTGIQPHKDTRIIVSTIPDNTNNNNNNNHNNSNINSNNKNLKIDERFQQDEVPRVDISHLVDDETLNNNRSNNNNNDIKNTKLGKEVVLILEQLLLNDFRLLTDKQWTIALQKSAFEPTVLYLTLASKILKKWASSDSNKLILTETVNGVLMQIIDSIERKYGNRLIRLVIGYISFAKNGINDIEMEDLLSLDDSLMDIVFQYTTPNIRRLPTHIWLRVRQELSGLIVERDNGLLIWSHSILRDYAALRFGLNEIKQIHMTMGRYFGGLIDPTIRIARKISNQSLTYTETLIWFRSALINERHCIEGIYQIMEGGLYKEASKKLCDLDFICACAKLGELETIVHYLHRLTVVFSRNEDFLLENENNNNNNDDTKNEYNEMKLTIDHFHRWLQQSIPQIMIAPAMHIFTSCTANQPVVSHARFAVESLLRNSAVINNNDGNNNISNINNNDQFLENTRYDQENDNNNDNDNYSQSLSGRLFSKDAWIRGRVLGGKEEFSRLVHTYRNHSDKVNCIQYDPTGTKIASGASDYLVKIWDISTGNVLFSLEGHLASVMSIGWNNYGKKVASASKDKLIKIWDVETGLLLSTLKGHSNAVNTLQWSPIDNRIVSGSRDTTLRVWDGNTYTLLFSLQGHTDSVNSVCWSPDATKIVSGSSDFSVIIWDVHEKTILNTLMGHLDIVNSVKWNPNNNTSQIISGSQDNTVWLWDAVSGSVINVNDDQKDPINAICFNATGELAVIGFTNLKIIDVVNNGNVIMSLQDYNMTVLAVDWNPNNNQLIAACDNTIRAWNVTNINNQTSVSSNNNSNNNINNNSNNSINNGPAIPGHTQSVNELSWNNNGRRIASCSEDGTVLIWDTTSNCVISTLKSMPITGNLTTQVVALKCISYNPNDNMLSTGASDGKVSIWRMNPDGTSKNSKPFKILDDHIKSVNAIVWNSNGTLLATGSDDHSIRIWNCESNFSLMNTFRGHSKSVLSLSWNMNDQYLVSGSEDTSCRVWEIESGSYISALRGHHKSVNSVCWDKDGNRVVSGSLDTSIKIWLASTGQLIATLKGHTKSVCSVHWSPDNKRIVSSSFDETILLWDAVNMTLISIFDGHSLEVTSVRWSPEGGRIASCSADQTVRVWDTGSSLRSSSSKVTLLDDLEDDWKLITVMLPKTSFREWMC
eukprot:gene5419-7508_t